MSRYEILVYVNYDSIPVFIYLSFVHAHARCGSECNWKKLKLKYENLLKLDFKKIYNTLSSGPLAQSTVG